MFALSHALVACTSRKKWTRPKRRPRSDRGSKFKFIPHCGKKNDRLHNSPMYSRHLYLSVWGTCLRVSKHEFKTDLEIQEAAPLISTFSMQDAEAGLATDYTKRKHVIRVRIPNGPQFLIRCETERDAVLWIDAMQASINVSCDLDTRPMPEFAFARRRRLHHRGHSRRRRGAGSSS